MNVRRVTQFSIIYVVGVFAGDVLLRKEARGSQLLIVIWIGGRKQLSNHCQRARMTASCLGATGGTARDQEAGSVLTEVTGRFSPFCELPKSRQTNAVRMQ